MDFEKRPLPVSAQIQLLISRGMEIPDLVKAQLFLSNISYYRLSAYWYTFLKNPKTEHLFEGELPLIEL
jgi:abortive infection bacteriophage resistance protein